MEQRSCWSFAKATDVLHLKKRLEKLEREVDTPEEITVLRTIVDPKTMMETPYSTSRPNQPRRYHKPDWQPFERLSAPRNLTFS
jgi:hypothetical protein